MKIGNKLAVLGTAVLLTASMGLAQTKTTRKPGQSPHNCETGQGHHARHDRNRRFHHGLPAPP